MRGLTFRQATVAVNADDMPMDFGGQHRTPFISMVAPFMNRNQLYRFFRNFVLLFGLWFALSGMTQPLLLGFGVFSSLVTSWLMTRLVYTRDDPLAAFRPVRLVLYSLWLIGQIIKSSARVMYLVLHPRMPISPSFVRVRAEQITRLGRVSFANSITLTPGTASVEIDDTHILVHGLVRDEVQSLQQGDMGRFVRACESLKGGAATPGVTDPNGQS